MGVVAIARSLKSKKSLLIAFSFSLALGLGLGLPDSAWADNNATLSKLEKWLFFATFSGESDADRIKRIEEKTFGEAAEGSIDERLSKLDQILTQRQKEKEESAAPAPVLPTSGSSGSASTSAASPSSSTGGKSEKAGSSDPAHNFGASTDAGHNFGSSPGQAGSSLPSYGSAPAARQSPPAVEDAEAAKERQRIAVQAAREQEMHDLLQEGARLWRSRHGQEAVEKFEQVLRLDPQNPDAHFSIGVIQESMGKLKEARTHYLTASQTNPENRDYQEAVNAVTRRLQAPPSDPNRALTEKANAAFKRGEYISAVNMYKELEEKSPKQASVKFSLGTTFLMMKDHFNALEYFKLAHQLEPNNVKYTTAFNDLSAEMAKHQEAQQGVESTYQTGGAAPTAANSQIPVAAAKSGKGKNGKQVKQQLPPQNQAASGGGPGNMPQQQSFNGYQNQGGPQQQPQQMVQQGPPMQQQQMMMQQQQMPMQQQQMPMQQQQMPMQQQQMPMQQQQMPMQQQQMPMQQQQMPMQQQQMPMQQRPMQQAYQGGAGPYGQQNTYASSMNNNNNNNNNQGTYIPPDPQAFASPTPQQAPPQQMPQQMQQRPQQMPAQMQQQMPPMSQGNQQYAGGNQYGGGNGNGMQNQYGGNGQTGGQSDYTPPPQPAPQGRYDPRLAQQLNGPSGSGQHSKNDPMEHSGISGHGSNEGVMITSVRGGSRAERAGLRKGDVIRTVDGNEVMQPAQLNQVLSQYDSSQTLPLLIFRDGTITPIQF